MIRRYELPKWRVTPEPAIGPRFARTRWAYNPPYGLDQEYQWSVGAGWSGPV
jgi:hypothetical protein